ncbi:MAG: hypothetical protein IK065_05390 [Neisseriaceae bacterium]|nr:hypothetical protein [Neisseriaceae bacterium]
MYFNNFLLCHIGRLVSREAHPTAFLFQKLGFAGVSKSLPESIFNIFRQTETFAKLVDVSKFQSCSSIANKDITSRKVCR